MFLHNRPILEKVFANNSVKSFCPKATQLSLLVATTHLTDQNENPLFYCMISRHHAAPITNSVESIQLINAEKLKPET